MLNCPRCQGQEVVKSGRMAGRQRYKCKACHYHYTVAQRSGTSTAAQRRLALNLYLEGLDFRSIGRLLGFSHVAVYHWIRAFGEPVESVRAAQPVRMVEWDEMHRYVRQKKTMAGPGLLLIDLDNAVCLLSRGARAPKPASGLGQPSRRPASTGR